MLCLVVQVTGGTGAATIPSAASEPVSASASASASTSSTSVADYNNLTDPAVNALLEAARPLGADVCLCELAH